MPSEQAVRLAQIIRVNIACNWSDDVIGWIAEKIDAEFAALRASHADLMRALERLMEILSRQGYGAELNEHYKQCEARLERARALGQAAPDRVSCRDCRAPYGADGWCDVIVPNEVWNKIAPNDGVLCFRCMTKRIEAHGLKNVSVNVVSGPYSDNNERWRQIGFDHGYRVAKSEGQTAEPTDTERPSFLQDAWEIARKVAEIDKQLLSTQAVEAFAELAQRAYDAAMARRPFSKLSDANSANEEARKLNGGWCEAGHRRGQRGCTLCEDLL